AHFGVAPAAVSTPLVNLYADVVEGHLLQNAGLRVADLAVQERQRVVAVCTTHEPAQSVDAELASWPQRPRLVIELEDLLDLGLDPRFREGGVSQCRGEPAVFGTSGWAGIAEGVADGLHAAASTRMAAMVSLNTPASDAISRTARSGVQWVSLPPGPVASGAGPQVPSRSRLRAATAPLALHPCGHISIPGMASVLDRAKRRQDEVPAMLILYRSPRSQRDERAPFVASNTPIYCSDELLIEGDLKPHKTSVSELRPGLLLQPPAGQRA